jgi:integrase
MTTPPKKTKKALPRQKSSTGKRAHNSTGIDPRQMDWVSEVASTPTAKPARQARGKRKMVEGEDGKLRMVWLNAEQAAEDRAKVHAARYSRQKHRSGPGKGSRVRRKPVGFELQPGDDVLKTVEARYPGSFERQLLAVVTEFPQPAQIGIPREVSFETKEDRLLMAQRVPKDLKAEGFRLERLSSLSYRHVSRLVDRWQARGMAASTLVVNLSTLRAILTTVGMRRIVPAVATFERYPGELSRQSSATVAKGWIAKGVDPTEAFERVKRKCVHSWHVLRMCAAFGLRAQEGLCARPARMYRDSTLYVEDGTKGGRPRIVPVLTDDQREVLRAAIEFATSRACKKGTLTRRGYTAEQDEGHFYYVLSSCGITAKGLGVTVHGLRHDYLTTRFEQVSGVPAPVVGGMTSVAGLPKDVLREAQQMVSHEAGHARRSISTAYLGSARNIKATEMSQMRDRLQQLEYHAPTVAWLHSVGPGDWFIVGDHAMGRLPMGKRTQLMLAGTLKRLDLVVAGARALTERIGFPVTVVDISTVDPETPRLELVSLSLLSPANEPVLRSESNTAGLRDVRISQEPTGRPDDDDELDAEVAA